MGRRCIYTTDGSRTLASCQPRRLSVCCFAAAPSRVQPPTNSLREQHAPYNSTFVPVSASHGFKAMPLGCCNPSIHPSSSTKNTKNQAEVSLDHTCISLVNAGDGHTIGGGGGGGGGSNTGGALRPSRPEPSLLPVLLADEALEPEGSSAGKHEGKWKPRTWEFLHLRRPEKKRHEEGEEREGLTHTWCVVSVLPLAPYLETNSPTPDSKMAIAVCLGGLSLLQSRFGGLNYFLPLSHSGWGKQAAQGRADHERNT